MEQLTLQELVERWARHQSPPPGTTGEAYIEWIREWYRINDEMLRRGGVEPPERNPKVED